MTSAQKIAKEKFKKAIAYRQKSGVSLKEAFAHVYGKKKIAKKVVRKKVAKKRISGPKDSAAVKRELARKGLKMPHGYSTTKRKRKISGVKKKKISETGILNKIHIVKRNVDKLDEAQHKHMMNGIEDKMFKDLYALREKIASTKQAILKLQGFAKLSPSQKHIFTNKAKQYKKYLIELNTHYRELKKHI